MFLPYPSQPGVRPGPFQPYQQMPGMQPQLVNRGRWPGSQPGQQNPRPPRGVGQGYQPRMTGGPRPQGVMSQPTGIRTVQNAVNVPPMQGVRPQRQPQQQVGQQQQGARPPVNYAGMAAKPARAVSFVIPI